jgi:hypothetical protein
VVFLSRDGASVESHQFGKCQLRDAHTLKIQCHGVLYYWKKRHAVVPANDGISRFTLPKEKVLIK